jgi:hypothetical protein
MLGILEGNHVLHIITRNVSDLGAESPYQKHNTKSLCASGLKIMSQLYCYSFYVLTKEWVIQCHCFNSTGYLLSNEAER